MPITITGFHHAGFLVTDAERAARFYEDTLGLKALQRPVRGFPGRWSDRGKGQHPPLRGGADIPAPAAPPRHDRHIALSVPDVRATERQLREMGVAISYGSGRA